MKLISFACLLLLSIQASSHKVLTMVYTTGMTVEGQIAFSDGSFAPKDTSVQVFKNEERVGEVAVDDFGRFVYQAVTPSDYRFHVDMGAGHIANMQVAAEDFSAYTEVSGADNLSESAVESSVYTSATLEAVVAKQIRPLREEIFALKEKRYWMDILGGIGFILGVFGVAAWVQSRKYAKPTS
ncbi:MAG: hypothetical protein OXE99_00560 [Cellvibrionales bacterium]|nr:hypothetical protein [Cellvibrionales bacterium]